VMRAFKKRFKTGFTLFEVMVTVAILSFGLVVIFEGLFNTVDAFSYCSDYLNIQPWLNSKIWELQDELTRTEILMAGEANGDFTIKDRRFDWKMTVSPADLDGKLYEFNLALTWLEGNRKVNISRNGYVLKPITLADGLPR